MQGLRKSRKNLLLIIISIVFLLSGCSSDESTNNTNTTQNPQKPEVVAKSGIWGVGTYKVGSDIQEGLYKVKLTDTLTGMAYLEKSERADMSVDSITANIILQGDGYIRVLEDDKYIKLSGCELVEFNYDEYSNIVEEAADGIYLVNKDLKPGTYKVEITDKAMGMGYAERVNDVTINFDSIIANEIFQGPGYLDILETDFAVRLQAVKITFVE